MPVTLASKSGQDSCRRPVKLIVAKQAIIAVMRKLALSLWYVARGEAFDARKLFNTRGLGIAV